MYEQSHRDYLRLAIRITACCGLLIIIRITCHYFMWFPARQKCQRTEAGERKLLTCRCVSVTLLRSMQNTRLELADAKAENDARVMMLPLVIVVGCTSAVRQSVRSQWLPPAGIMQPLPTGRHCRTGLFHPQREADWLANNQRTQKYINEQCR